MINSPLEQREVEVKAYNEILKRSKIRCRCGSVRVQRYPNARYDSCKGGGLPFIVICRSCQSWWEAS